MLRLLSSSVEELITSGKKYEKMYICIEDHWKQDSSILKNTALLSLLAEFTTNLYIQIVYTIRKLCTLSKKIVHFTIFFEQE